ncbi:MAG: nucleoside deaminase [Bacteroidota bacterium]
MPPSAAMDDAAAFMRQAIALAQDNIRTGGGGPFGALVVRHGEIVGRGVNRVTTTHDPTAHAEVVAIRDACTRLGTFQLTDCTLYTTCEPCPMCLGAIYWARLQAVYYACTRHDAAQAHFDDALIYDEIPLDPSARRLPFHPLLRDEAQALFTHWLGSDGRVAY